MNTLSWLFNLIPGAFWKASGYLILFIFSIKLLHFTYKKYFQPHAGPWIKWGNQSAMLIGWPILVMGGLVCMSKITFSVTCLSAGYKCEYALGVSEMAQQYLTNLVGGTADINVTPRTSKPS